MNKFTTILLITVIILIGIFIITSQPQTAVQKSEVIAKATYYCDGGNNIEATYKKKGDDITPVDSDTRPPAVSKVYSVNLKLSDGRAFDLHQTISASGARYSDGNPDIEGDESFVFWNKGVTALVLENNTEKTYIGCIEVSADPGGLPLVYTSGVDEFSVRYPNDFIVDNNYFYQGIQSDIHGVKFTIAPHLATNANLGSDSYLSIERNSSATDSCSASNFISSNFKVTPKTVTIADMTYSVASTTDAGAGNRYEEWVYAIPGSNPCLAIRYFIHYSVFENYPADTIIKFDKASLLNEFDKIRDSVIFQ